ncbi:MULTISPECIES: DUF1684 domain-containing protein [Arthrobacter]|uniref:DUF1684 domain-containing protein n=2 Tax=Arthrobacter TaxID=1663 RepID=A0ABU9KP39_9MICC|nr:DUF1684 domain-containing protein [Arthrobacter sp. YJM1]MDP5228592.1 DUF1684 domain-containing protein [Arthrobacter sp. YJM1]
MPSPTDTVSDQPTQLQTSWEAWHAVHEQQRATEHGFLAVTGLHFLDSEPARIPGIPGLWNAVEDTVTITLTALERLGWEGRELNPDGTGSTTVLGPVAERDALYVDHGRVRIEVARRGGFLVVRPRDPEHPLRTEYPGTPAYPASSSFVVDARVEFFESPQAVTVGAVVEGIEHVYEAPARLHFELGGQEHVLTAFNGHAPGTLNVLFTDLTSGNTTYAANRSVTVTPREDGTAVLDFNRAVNLPCAYTDFATCPLPPAGNRLPVAVEAGEKLPLERQDAA